MSVPTFIAVDWGTSNCRARVVRQDKADPGIWTGRGARELGPDDFDATVRQIRANLGDHPMLLSGMVGSSIGWALAPYCSLPVTITDLAEAALWMDDRTAIVPGAKSEVGVAGDVMRGEEIQMLGAAMLGASPADGLFCQPGTHTKWARLDENALKSFVTSLTGELFNLLCTCSILAGSTGGMEFDEQAFAEGVEQAKVGELLNDLFQVRAGDLLHSWPKVRCTSFLSGLIIGRDCFANLGPCTIEVALVSSGRLAELYRRAIEQCGAKAIEVDSSAAHQAGLEQIAGRLFAEGQIHA